MLHSILIFMENQALQILRPLLLFSFIIVPLSSLLVTQCKALSKENSTLKISHTLSELPQPVRKMRAAIIRAAKSGDIAAMKTPLQRNEIQPVVDFDSKLPPIEYWLSISEEGNGRDILSHLIEIFMKPYAVIHKGTDKERYIWPYLAEIDVKRLSPKQEVDMLRLVTIKQYMAMKKTGRYMFYRASIGKDGTWHLFVREK